MTNVSIGVKPATAHRFKSESAIFRAIEKSDNTEKSSGTQDAFINFLLDLYSETKLRSAYKV